MIDPLNQHHVSLMARLKRTRQAAFAILLLEGMSAALWRVFSWTCLFAGFWLLQVPSFFGAAGAGMALAVFIGGLLYYIRRDVLSFRMPGRFAVDRRLEQAGGVHHRPLTVIEDKLSQMRQPAATAALWKLNKEQALDSLKGLRLPRPKPLIAALDPGALRILAVLIAFIGFIAAGPQAVPRLKQGLFPYAFGGKTAAFPDVSIWITPPAYTGLQPVVINGGKTDKPIAIPEGSIIKARAGHGWGHPRLSMGDASLPFAKLDDGNWGIETPIRPGTHIVIRQAFTKRADIGYKYLVDQKPEIEMKGDPETLLKGQWQFNTSLKDDYGVTTLTLHMKLDPAAGDAPLGKPVDDIRPVMTQGGVATAMKPVYDMTWHTWAGLPVIVTLEARDYKGQSATTPPIKLKLPERPFRTPVAQEIISLRKRLTWTPEASALNVAFGLETLMSKPDAYGGDITTFLSLRTAASHLMYDPTVEAAGMVVPQLWDTALKIEDGDLSLATRNFRQAQQDIQKLLNDPKATPEQIAAAMEKLRDAMGQYLQESFREMQKRMAENGIEPPTPEEISHLLKTEDIQAFLDQLQAQALNGDKDAAREMLSQLEKMTDMMDPSRAHEMPEDMQKIEKAYQELQKLKDEQKALMEQTKKIPSNGNCDGQAMAQKSLQGRLEQLMPDVDEATGGIPQSMQDADKAMRQSGEELDKDHPGQSVPHQQEAIDKLQQGQQDMAQKLRERMKQMMMAAFGAGKLDPLGRPMDDKGGPSLLPNSNVKIPDQGERKRVQDILRLLRQRSGELDRPEYELEYYRRLMRQF